MFIIKFIYGFEISHETISEITDCVLDELNDWQNRPLKKMYTFLFVDCMYVTIRKEYESKSYAVNTILGYDTNGEKDILGLWLNESESKHTWMQIFDELKSRGVEDVLFISMDGVSGLEEGAKAIFKDVVVQRCMVHLIRNSIKYVPSKDYKKFTQSLKKVYGAPSLNACKKAFEQFCQEWSQYPRAVDVWKRNFSHVEQLFDYGSAVRRVMYTTKPRDEVAFMTATEIAKRRRAEKTAYAINSIEGVPISEETKRLSSQWANGELTIEQIKAELVKKYKAKTT